MSLRSIKKSRFLGTVYKELDYINGSLFDIYYDKFNKEDYINKSEWINVSKYINESNKFNIEKIFFVENNPMILFVYLTDDSINLTDVYNSIWCIARPRLLYIATETELVVLDLANKPFSSDDELRKSALEIVNNTVEILTKLYDFRREQIESGKLFEHRKFNSVDYRADISLIKDLKIVRDRLFGAGLGGSKLKYAHSLIGRSIFIRYLEDRKILSKEYFYMIAKGNSVWENILDEKLPGLDLNQNISNSYYIKILSNFDFSYKFFDKLAHDFNGDIFPTDSEERKNIQIKHLVLLQELLRGDAQLQKQLFFQTYKFDIIPIEIISNIYEEFYHFRNDEAITQQKDSNGTHYTPAALVEFVINKVITKNVLKLKPRILDPACGSGIFLVGAFNRIIRNDLFEKKKENLSFTELKKILKNQICGIELNPEAIKISAFSLYLAFLNAQKPRDILKQIEIGNRLPCLIYVEKKDTNKEYYDNLINCNSFLISEYVRDKKVSRKFGSNSIDVVIGNPPWGRGSKDESENRNHALLWCQNHGYTVSGQEYSQMFLWLSFEMLKKNKVAGLLISSGNLIKYSEDNNNFKKEFLKLVKVEEVVNFIHVRDTFFNAIAPFVLLNYKKKKPKTSDKINYWTVRRTKIIENTQVLVLDNTDYKFFHYDKVSINDIWKIYYFGNKNDLALISALRLNNRMCEVKNYIDNDNTGRGFQSFEKKFPSDWLENYKELPPENIERYGKIDFKKLKTVPSELIHKGKSEGLYHGNRILIVRGIRQTGNPKGQIIARYATEKFCFRNSVHCIKLLPDKSEEDYKLLLAIIWSSLMRYYFFMTSSSWSVWHDDVKLGEYLEMPIILPPLQDNHRLLEIVNNLCKGNFKEKINDLSFHYDMNDKLPYTQAELENDLNDEIFKLYSLTQEEIDLVNDRCNYDIDFYYNHSKSKGIQSITKPQISSGNIGYLELYTINLKEKTESILIYIKTLLDCISPYIENRNQIVWKLICPSDSPMIAIIISKMNTLNQLDSNLNLDFHEIDDWAKLLTDLSKLTSKEYSSKIYMEGIIRYISNSQIIIIKRNEKRLWTKTAAREDAEAVFLNFVSTKQDK